jgi:hypothetical protein
MKLRNWVAASAAGAAAVVVVVVAAAAGRPAATAARPVETRRAEPATNPVPVVVELFTSEGCSSCPPADALLQDLLANQPVAGALVIGLSEHVDYWNQLGWRDPFSDARFTDRQHRYSQATSSEVYTPQMIVDGTSAFVGSDRAAVLHAIGTATTRAKSPVTLAWTPASQLDVTIAQAPTGDDVLLAIVEDGLSSAVKSGENAGRTITHSAVTRRLQGIGTTDRAGACHVTVPVTVDSTWRRSALSAIVIVQHHAQGSIEGAAALRWVK